MIVFNVCKICGALTYKALKREHLAAVHPDKDKPDDFQRCFETRAIWLVQ